MIPRCDWIRQRPYADLFLPGDQFSGSKNPVARILLVMPSESCLDEGYGNIRPIHYDSGNEPSVTVPLLAFDANLLPEHEVRRELLRPLGEIRASLKDNRFHPSEFVSARGHLLFFTLNREDFSFVIHLDRQPRTSRRREAQTGSRARSGSRSERTLDAVEHSRTLMEWWPFLIFHRGGLRIKVINNTIVHG